MIAEDPEARKLIAETPSLYEYIISRVKLLGGMKRHVNKKFFFFFF